MDLNIVYARTPAGDEAVRQSTRLVQRNLRMLLVQIDGKVSVGKLVAKLGNEAMVLNTLRDLCDEGFIAPVGEAADLWAHASVASLPPQTVMASSLAAAETVLGSVSSVMGPPSRIRKPAHRPGSAGPRAVRKRDWRLPDVATLVRYVFLGLIGGGLLLAALLVFYPYDSLRPQLQARLTQSMRQPVTLGSIDLKLTPFPRLSFSDIRIGAESAGQVRVEHVALPVRPSWLWAGIDLPEQIDVHGLSAQSDALLGLTRSVAVSNGTALRRVRLSAASLGLGQRSINELGGDLLLQADGKFDRITLQRTDRTMKVMAVNMPSGVLVSLEAFGWRPAEDVPVFASLQAKGVITPGRLFLQDIDARLLGGAVRGEATLAWAGPNTLSGVFSLARIDAGGLVALVNPKLQFEGMVDGSLRLRATRLPDAPFPGQLEAILDMEVKRGVLRGIDVTEVTRRTPGDPVRGGETRFDTLTGAVQVTPERLEARGLRLQAGMLTAEGGFNIAGDQVDGQLAVSIRSSVNVIRTPVRISGNTAALTATAAR